MFETDQYLNDPIPGAVAFIGRIDHPSAMAQARTSGLKRFTSGPDQDTT